MENAQTLALTAHTPCLSEETKEKLVQAFETLYAAVKEAVQKIAEALRQLFAGIENIFDKVRRNLYRLAVPPRVYHLAYHAKKGRTRKKNMRRIQRYWEELYGYNKIH